MANFNSASFIASYVDVEAIPPSVNPEVSFVGRSNVGKSSIMNKIFNRKNLVKVSSTPGKTQAINFFRAGDVDFIDLPGYGFARVSKEEKKRWSNLIEGYFNLDRKFALVVSLIDIRHDPSADDIKMVEYLCQSELPFAIALTKADKLSKSKAQSQIRAICKKLPAEAQGAIVIPTSSANGTGITDVRDLIQDAADQAR